MHSLFLIRNSSFFQLVYSTLYVDWIILYIPYLRTTSNSNFQNEPQTLKNSAISLIQVPSTLITQNSFILSSHYLSAWLISRRVQTIIPISNPSVALWTNLVVPWSTQRVNPKSRNNYKLNGLLMKINNIIKHFHLPPKRFDGLPVKLYKVEN